MTADVTVIPDGFYAVPDPRDAEQITLWRVHDDAIEPSPVRARYGPVLLRSDDPAGLEGAERSRWIDDWLEAVYYPWHRAIRDAITADPDAAGALYANVAVRCRNCGRKLTDATSKATGWGPDCRRR